MGHVKPPHSRQLTPRPDMPKLTGGLRAHMLKNHQNIAGAFGPSKRRPSSPNTAPAMENFLRSHLSNPATPANALEMPRLPHGCKSVRCPAPVTSSDVPDLKMSRKHNSSDGNGHSPKIERGAPVKVAWHQHWQPKTANHVGKRMPTMVTAASNGVSYGHHMEIKILMATPIANVPAPSGAARKKLMMSAAGCYLKDYPNKTPSPLQPSCLR